MHWRRIDGDEQARARDQRGKREQVRFARKIDHAMAHFRFDVADVCLLERRWAASQYEIDIVFIAGVIYHFRPTLRVPKFFRARRARMKNYEGSPNVLP